MLTLQTMKISSKQEKVRELVLSIFLQNHELTYLAIAKKSGASVSTVKRVILNYRKGLPNIHKKGSGRKAGSDKNLLNEVKNLFGRNPTLSVRDVAVRAGTTKCRVLKIRQKNYLRTYRVQKVPVRSNEKQLVADNQARKLYMEHLPKFDCYVMDDETCVTANFRQVPGHEFYTLKKKGQVQ